MTKNSRSFVKKGLSVLAAWGVLACLSQAAAQESLIAQAEALALLASGTMPASLAAAIATLPAPEQFAAQMSILGDANFSRTNALVAALGTAMGKTSADIDALFTLAASL